MAATARLAALAASVLGVALTSTAGIEESLADAAARPATAAEAPAAGTSRAARPRRCGSGRHRVVVKRRGADRVMRCVRVPRGARRPDGVRQQGGPALRLESVEWGLGAGPGHREAGALAWARTQLGSRAWSWYCERFAEVAYGTTGRYASAWIAAQRIGLRAGPPEAAPAGTLMYFGPDRYNGGYGHVGLSLGDGRMISALSSVKVDDVRRDRYWRALYRGWAYAPASWPGRIPPPPAVTAPPQAAPPVAVRLAAPASDATVSGTTRLTAEASGVSGIAFDAYYATDPSNANTTAWHRIGADTTPADGFTADWDTRGIPNQGNPGWGTVNVVAVGLDASGRATSTRDYRRVTVSNSPASVAPAPAPAPQPPAHWTYRVAGTCADGACGLNLRAGPGYSAYAVVRRIPEGATVDIVCQARGERVSNGRASSAVWDRLRDGTWAADFYVDTPNVDQFTAPIPPC